MAISTREELLKTMRATPVILGALLRDFDPATLRRRPRPDEWSAGEVVCHLADTEERALARVRRMLAEHEPELPGYDQAALAVERGYRDLDPLAELGRYEQSRGEHLTLLASLGDDGWGRVGRHSEHGPMSVELYVAHVAAEDVDHLAQIARALTS